jgi:tryptophan synthase alpha chain
VSALNRIDRRFAALAAEGRSALVPYVTAGHPHPDYSVDILHAAVAAGADLLELGMPFSDVMADGPVIQNACARALQHGTTLHDVLAMVAKFRQQDADTPVILMGYTNPIERMGMSEFAKASAEAGVDAVLVVDCPADEAAELQAAMTSHDLHQIFLVAPTTTATRLDRTARLAGGFIYYVSLTGVTGAATLDVSALAPKLADLRKVINLPVAVGFGIREPEQAAAVAAVADAVVIGSALVQRLDACQQREQAVAVVEQYLGAVRAAMDAATAQQPARAMP